MALVKQIYLVLKSPMLSDNILILEINYINMVLLILKIHLKMLVLFHFIVLIPTGSYIYLDLCSRNSLLIYHDRISFSMSLI